MHFMDSIFIFGLMLVLFGPKKLPEIARQAGKLMMEFRRASNDFKLQMEEELRSAEQAERQRKWDEENRAALALAASSTPAGPLPDATPTPVQTLLAVEAPPTFSGVAPVILPPSSGDIVSTLRPNRVEDGPADTADSTLPRELDHSATETFYAQREAGFLPEVALSGGDESEPPSTTINDQNGVAAITTDKAIVPVTPAPIVLPAKLPGTEMYPETAPMAESDQAPIHHG